MVLSMEPVTLEQLKKSLEDERARLTAELKSFAVPDPKMRGDWDTRFPAETELASMSHAAQDEQADFREEYETEIAQEHALELRLREVEGALERIAGGTYGQCRSCGRAISEERLMANPAAEYDMEHQPRE